VWCIPLLVEIVATRIRIVSTPLHCRGMGAGAVLCSAATGIVPLSLYLLLHGSLYALPPLFTFYRSLHLLLSLRTLWVCYFSESPATVRVARFAAEP
jgi:hypothetical protein